MPGTIALIIIVGTVAGLLIFFLVRSVIIPQMAGSLADMLKHGRSQQVIRACKKILAKEPRSPDAHYLLGQAYLAEGKTELALMEFKMVNDLGLFDEVCQEIPFRRQMGDLFRRFKQYEEALKEYLLLIQKEPAVADHYFQAGGLFEERQMAEKAFQFYQKALELDSRHLGAHMNMGILLTRQRKHAEARAEFEMALKLDPDDPKIHYHLGRLQKELHDFSLALRSFEKAQRDPELKIKALIEAGTCYMSQNNMERSIVTLERALGLLGQDAGNEALYCRYFLALCYERIRKIDMAISQWEFIYAKKPTFRDVGQKLSQYQDLRADDRMKDYMSSSKEAFLAICQRILKAMKLEIRETAEIRNGLQFLAVESEKNWRSGRVMPWLVWFFRITEPIDEPTVRILLEKMKADNLSRGVLITSSGYSRKALEYAETRPVDLIDRDRLSGMLRTSPG